MPYIDAPEQDKGKEPSKPPKINPCPSDGPIGALVIVIGVLLAGISLISSVAISMIVSIFPTFFFPRAQGPFVDGTNFGAMPEPTPASQVPFYLVMALLIGLSAAIVYCGIGIRKANQAAFSLSIVLFGLGATGGGGWSVFCISIAVYCVLRKLNLISSHAR